MKQLTQEQKDIIEQMIYGPYLPEWYREDGTIGNTDREIAERLNVPTWKVSNYSTKLGKEKYKRLFKEKGFEL